MIKLVLLFVFYFLATSDCSQLAYKYKNGKMTLNNLVTERLDGSFFYSGTIVLKGMDMVTMTWILIATTIGTSTIKDNYIDLEQECNAFVWEKGNVYSKGKVTIKGNMTNLIVKGECNSEMDKTNLKFEINGVYTDNPYYRDEEAGTRAMYLVGQPITRYRDVMIPSYALSDSPISQISCRIYREHCELQSEPKPGLVIIDKKKITVEYSIAGETRLCIRIRGNE